MASTAKQHDCRSSRRRLMSGRRNRRSRSRARAAAFTKIVADFVGHDAAGRIRGFGGFLILHPRCRGRAATTYSAIAPVPGFTSWSHSKLDLDRHLGQTVKPWRLHDLRRAVATGMADIGIEPHHIEAVLNHYSGHRRGVAGTSNLATKPR